MLPEHVTQFIQYNKEKNLMKQPILDEQKLEEINGILRIAIEDYSPVYLSIYSDGRIKEIHCHINKFDQLYNELRISTDSGREKIRIVDVVDIKIV